MYLEPDITGKNPLYKIDNFVRVVSKIDQKIYFRTPVFKKSIGLTLLGTSNITLFETLDWVINDNDIDDETTSLLKVQYPDFNEILVKSVTIVRAIVGDQKIGCVFQRLYPLHYRNALLNDRPLEVTPTLVAELLEKMDYVLKLTKPVSDHHSLIEGPKPRLLEPDPYLENSNNIILEEDHEVNVPGGHYLIHPICGAFFKGTFSAKQVLPNGTFHNLTPVNNGVGDYVIFNLDSKKTQVTSHKPGVYQFILIVTPIVGKIRITYHAYGGDPTIYDMSAIYEQINNIIAHINEGKFLTPDSLYQAPIISNLVLKLNALENEVRRLAKSGKPSYGDVTRGCLLKRIKSTDTDLHWFTIAELYKVDGSDDVFLSDRMHLQIKASESKFMFDAMIGVDITNPNKKLDVNIISEIYPKGYIPFEDYSQIDFYIRPQFRIIWNENVSRVSGIYLQIGWELKNMAEETLAINDVSDIQSCWKLINEIDDAVGPEDSIIILPDPQHVWDLTNTDSKYESSIIPFKDGYLAWAGLETLNRHEDGGGSGAQDYFLTPHFINESTDISKIRKVRLDLVERGANSFPIFIEFISETKDKHGMVAFEYNGKSARLILSITKDENTNEILIVLNADIEAGLLSNELDLHHLTIFA